MFRQAAAAVILAVSVGVPAAAASAASGAQSVPARLFITRSDLPHGWKEGEQSKTTPMAQVRTLATCGGESVAGIPSASPHGARSFAKTNGKTSPLTVTETIIQPQSRSAEAKTWAVLSNSTTPSCTGKAVAAASSATLTKTGLSAAAPVVSAVVATAFGPGTFKFSTKIHITGKGLSFTLANEAIGVLHGDYIIELTFGGLGSVPVSLERHVVAAAIGHLG